MNNKRNRERELKKFLLFSYFRVWQAILDFFLLNFNLQGRDIEDGSDEFKILKGRKNKRGIFFLLTNKLSNDSLL